jgi:two-component system phosphate regulon response regulator PhoB
MPADNLTSNYKVLVIDDDPLFQAAVVKGLPQEVSVISASSAKEARTQLEGQSVDLILLDLGLPDEDGMKLCSWIRFEERFLDIPLVLLTGRSDVNDKVMAFSLGADDYLVKPVDPKEFKARILAKLKRANRVSTQGQVFVKGSLKFLLASQQVFIAAQDIPSHLQRIETSPIEFRLLLLLAQNDERIFSRDELISKVWGNHVHVLERTVDSHVSDLRKKLALASHRIEAVRGVGYRLVPKSSPNHRESA